MVTAANPKESASEHYADNRAHSERHFRICSDLSRGLLLIGDHAWGEGWRPGQVQHTSVNSAQGTKHMAIRLRTHIVFD